MTASIGYRLPDKFLPHIISQQDPPGYEGLVQKVHTGFDKEFGLKTTIPGKKHVFTLPSLEGWVIKGPKSPEEFTTTTDTHLYRVRKAVKIQRLIEKHGLQGVLVVPKKFLYFESNSKVWYVLSQKLTLSSEALRIKNNACWKKTFEVRPGLLNLNNLKESDQIEFCKRLIKGYQGDADESRSITPVQAEGLAIMCFEAGLTDLHCWNIVFDNQGRIAIIDTEPYNRVKKKTYYSSWRKLFLDKSLIDIRESIKGTAVLKHSLECPKALQKVKDIENRYLFFGVFKAVAKMTLLYRALELLSAKIQSNGISPIIRAGGFCVIVVSSIRISAVGRQIFNLLRTFWLNRTGQFTPLKYLDYSATKKL